MTLNVFYLCFTEIINYIINIKHNILYLASGDFVIDKSIKNF